MDTNLPVEEILVDASDSWIETELQDALIAVRIDANGTNDSRTGEIAIKEAKGLIEPVIVEIKQDNILINKEGMVQFKDRAFKNACLEIADANHDGDISPEEALTVTELNISGKGIKDLTGLDAFKNVWKVDAKDNDIEDADILSSLGYLYWLDLRGNKNLRTFDVTGCSFYFEWCQFEVTEELQYKQYKRQVGICNWLIPYTEGNYRGYQDAGSDPYGEHAIFIDDPRTTQDWSLQNTIKQIQQHTKGNGKNKIVFVGTGFIDVDHENETYERMMNEALEMIFEMTEMQAIKEYFDIYFYYRLCEKHNLWSGTKQEKESDYTEFKIKYMNPFSKEKRDIESKAFAAVTTGDEAFNLYEGQEYRCLLVNQILGHIVNGSRYKAEYTYKAANIYQPSMSIYDTYTSMFLEGNTFIDENGKITTTGAFTSTWHISQSLDDYSEDIKEELIPDIK